MPQIAWQREELGGVHTSKAFKEALVGSETGVNQEVSQCRVIKFAYIEYSTRDWLEHNAVGRFRNKVNSVVLKRKQRLRAGSFQWLQRVRRIAWYHFLIRRRGIGPWVIAEVGSL